MVFVVDAVTRRVRRQPAGMSLVETLMAMVLLVFAFMLVFTLFHASLRYGLHVQQRVFASTIAARKMDEIRRWAWTKAPTGWNFHSDWTDVSGVTAPDAEHAGFYTSVDALDATLDTPGSFFESGYPLAERRRLTASVQKVRIRVYWDAPPLDERRSLLLVSLVREPPRAFREVDPIVITAAVSIPDPLPQDGTVSLSARAYDAENQQIPDVFFRWYVEPKTGQGTITSEDRDGKNAVFCNKYRLITGAWTHTGGTCRVKVRAVCMGVEKWALTDIINLQP